MADTCPRRGLRAHDKGSVRAASRVADVAVDFIKRQAGKKPMFLYIAGNEPHDPQYAPQHYLNRSRGDHLLINGLVYVTTFEKLHLLV